MPPILGQNEQETCQVCRFPRYLKPNLQVRVSSCFHRICDECIARLFRYGKGPCPICRKEIKKADLQAQTFEDLVVEKEVRVRKRVLRIFNKRLADFRENLKAYNDYLEIVEDIVNDIDVPATEERIAKYKRENQDNIIRNNAAATREAQAFHSYIEQERERKRRRKEEYRKKYVEEQVAKEVDKESILNELASSNRSAAEIVRHYTSNSMKVAGMHHTHAHTSRHELDRGGHAFHELDALVDIGASVDPFDTLYHNDAMEECYNMLDDYADGYMARVKDDPVARAGGFNVAVTYLRSLEAAFRGLFAEPPESIGDDDQNTFD